jgi:hypothetical protein
MQRVALQRHRETFVVFRNIVRVSKEYASWDDCPEASSIS